MNSVSVKIAAVIISLIQFQFSFGSIRSIKTTTAACIKSDSVKLYAGPGHTKNILWEVNKFMPLVILQKSGHWYQVQDVDADISWVEAKNIKLKETCGIVKVSEKVLSREGPGETFPVAKKRPFLRKYSTFNILKEKNNWVQLMDFEKNIFWLPKQALWLNKEIVN